MAGTKGQVWTPQAEGADVLGWLGGLLGSGEVNWALKEVFFPFQRQPGKFSLLRLLTGFAGGSVVKNPPANAGDTDTIPDPGRSHMPGSN